MKGSIICQCLIKVTRSELGLDELFNFFPFGIPTQKNTFAYWREKVTKIWRLKCLDINLIVPSVSIPFLPALPIIWRYVRVSNNWFWKVKGLRTMTRLKVDHYITVDIQRTIKHHLAFPSWFIWKFVEISFCANHTKLDDSLLNVKI